MNSENDENLALFTGREEYIELFEKTINSENPDYIILQFSGIAGIGKTSMRRKFTDILQKDYPKKACYAELDFAHSNIRSMEDALVSMCSNFMSRYNIAFPFFSMAYEEFLIRKSPAKAFNIMIEHKERDMKKIGKPIEPFKPMFPFLDSLINVAKLYYVSKDHIGREISNEKKQIKKYNDFQLFEKLPEYFVRDLNIFTNNSKDQKKIIFFFDTYEAIKRPVSHHRDSEFIYEDNWIRQIAENVHMGVSILLGREKICWNGDKKKSGKILSKTIDKLSRKETRKLLIKSGVTNNEICNIIMEKFKGYPLFITMAIEIYKKNVDKKKLTSEDFIFDRPEELMERFLSHLSPDETEALKIMSVVRYWDYHLLETLIREFCPGYHFTNIHKFKNYSFIQPIPETDYYYIHEQIKELLKSGMNREYIERIDYFLYKYFRDRSIPEHSVDLSPKNKNHLEAAAYYGIESGRFEETVDWINENYDLFRLTPFHNNIINIIEEVYHKLKHSQLSPSVKKLYISKCESMLGYLYISTDKKNIARILLESAYEVQRKLLGDKDFDLLMTMKHLGFLYRELYEYIRAIKILEQLLLKLNKDEERHMILKTLSLEELGLCYATIESDYEIVLNIYRKSLESAININNNYYLSKGLNNIGSTLISLGRYKEAKDFLENALVSRQKILHPEHYYLLNTQKNIGRVNRELGYLDASITILEDVLKKRSEYLSPSSRALSITQEELAAVYIEIGNYKKAFRFIKRVKKNRKKMTSVFILKSYYLFLKNLLLSGNWVNIKNINNELHEDISKLTFHPDHPRVLSYKNISAKVLLDQGQIEEAGGIFQFVLDKRIELLGYKNPITAETLDDYSDYYLRIKEYKKAERLLLDVIRIRQETLDPENYLIGKSLNKLGLIYIITSKYPNAEKCLTESLKILKNTFDKFGKDNINLAGTYHNLGLFFLKTGKYLESEFNLDKALSIRKYKFTGSHRDIAGNLLTLSALYSLTGREKESEDVFRDAVAMLDDYCKSDEKTCKEIKKYYIDIYCQAKT